MQTENADGGVMPLAQPSGDCLACWQVLERFQWAAGTALNSCGVSLGVRVNDAALLHPVLALLPPGWRAAATPAVDTLVFGHENCWPLAGEGAGACSRNRDNLTPRPLLRKGEGAGN